MSKEKVFLGFRFQRIYLTVKAHQYMIFSFQSYFKLKRKHLVLLLHISYCSVMENICNEIQGSQV